MSINISYHIGDAKYITYHQRSRESSNEMTLTTHELTNDYQDETQSSHSPFVDKHQKGNEQERIRL